MRIGNSRGVRIPKAMIDEAELTDEVEMRVLQGQIALGMTTPEQYMVRRGMARDIYDATEKREQNILENASTPMNWGVPFIKSETPQPEQEGDDATG